MNRQTAFYRKIAYLVGILVLLLLLVVLGFPSVRSSDGSGRVVQGGVLARIKEEQKISEIQLGEIDPAGETMRLATFGLRGVAVVYLWEKSNDYKMRKDWTNLAATLKQMEKVEPHFISVWRFQGWNLSYNVSAEFDDYRERYRWVIKGIKYLQDGIQYNKNEPMLVWDTGWFIAQKIGRADESAQFRRMFRVDPDFHPPERVGEARDNWLVGKEWFQRGCDMVDQGADLKRTTPVLFFSHPAMCQMNYADNLEKDGRFDGRPPLQPVFKQAADEWHAYGQREIDTSEKDPESGQYVKIRLNDVEALRREAERRIKELESLGPPNLRDQIREERRKQLSKAEREAMETPPEKRTEKQHELNYKADLQLKVNHEELARRMPAEVRSKALALAREAMDFQTKIDNINRYRQIVNFEYWRRHADVEQSPDVIEARKALFEADAEKGDLGKAKELYEKGFALWRKVLDANKGLVEDGSYGRDLMEAINRYKKLLDRRDEKMPSPFMLDDVIKLHKNSVSE